ncbi:porin [Bradyrhizobium sp. G127]|uniref:porin n=1 Tax=Bradyrhizobium sp. G127 TaxID=2904800 RepID=UPI001F3A5629|nr:porin [Bradyrhizobium sp. G127]MCF2523962.1 porin [Bradyrhizobium sp. G127]
MSKIKSLILGSAAVIAASAGAQAADLPVKAKAVQYVKICSLYGAGFYYIPGTDTCIKLGGYVQADANFNGGNYGKPAWQVVATDVNGAHSRDADFFTTRTRTQLNIDTRTATEYGVVRTFWSSNFQHSTGEGPSSGVLTMDYGFVQFAGFTFGKAVSVFQTPWGAYGGNQNNSFTLGAYDDATGVTQAAYTWQFGNGVSASVAVEDARGIFRGPLINGSAAPTAANLYTGVYASASGGNTAPDITGNIKIDQAAFTAQLSAAAHNIHSTYYGANETTGHPSDAWGFAIQGGLQLKNLPTGPGDKLSISGIYTDGAIKYVISGVTGTSFASYGGGEGGLGYNTFAAFPVADGVFATGGSIEKTKAWGFQGAFVHNWTPNWETSVFGSYTNVDFNTNASAILCAAPAAGTTRSVGATCNPDYNIWQIGSRTAWTPVQNLTFSAEVMYTTLDQNNTGTLTSTTAPTTFKPAGTYEYKDQGIVSGNIRVRRTW